MIDRITITALLLVATAVPAFAGSTRLPEPTTMTLFGLAAGGAYVAKRFINRK